LSSQPRFTIVSSGDDMRVYLAVEQRGALNRRSAYSCSYLKMQKRKLNFEDDYANNPNLKPQ
jgi:hypothetical protein